MKRLLILVSLGLALMSSMSCHAKQASRWTKPDYFGVGPSRCPWRVLEQQGFVNDIGTKVRFLGNIPARRHEYWIYFHDHVYFNNYRETRQLIVMGRGCKYAGSYTVPVDPLRIVGNDIIFDASPRDGNVMHFSNRLPPAFAWIDGENPTFVR